MSDTSCPKWKLPRVTPEGHVTRILKPSCIIYRRSSSRHESHRYLPGWAILNSWRGEGSKAHPSRGSDWERHKIIQCQLLLLGACSCCTCTPTAGPLQYAPHRGPLQGEASRLNAKGSKFTRVGRMGMNHGAMALNNTKYRDKGTENQFLQSCASCKSVCRRHGLQVTSARPCFLSLLSPSIQTLWPVLFWVSLFTSKIPLWPTQFISPPPSPPRHLTRPWNSNDIGHSIWTRRAFSSDARGSITA